MTTWTARGVSSAAWGAGEKRITLGPVLNLAAQSGDGEVVLTWDASTGSPWGVEAVTTTTWHRNGADADTPTETDSVDVASPTLTYEIQRAVVGLDWVELGSTTLLTITDDTVENGVSYLYRVRATQYASLHGEWSTVIGAWGTVEANPADVTPPSQVTGLVATGGTGQVVLSGYHATDNNAVTGYEVERDGVIVGEAHDATYTDSGLGEATEHDYRMRAFDAAGNRGAWSDVASTATADVTAPTLMSGIAPTITDTTCVLDWLDATDNVGVSGYDVQYANNASFTGATYVSPDPTTSTCTITLTGGAWYFRYRAYDAAGNVSSWSDTASGFVFIDYTFASTYFVNADITALVA